MPLRTLLATTTLISSSVFGHVFLLSPTGGEVLEVGTTYEVSWRVTVPHDTINWDLHYSTSGQKGPWVPVAIDIPVGDSSQNSIHTYDWTVPNTVSDMVWVRVTQDNKGGNYDDTNDQACAIVVPATCNGDINMDDAVGVGDLLQIIEQWGQMNSPADISGDGIVSVGDLLIVVGTWGACD